MTTAQCRIAQEGDVYVAIGYGRELANRLGFDHIERTKIEIAILELARNILAHAVRGELCFMIVEQNAIQGLAIEARDQGPGIEDIELALRDGYSTKKTLGAGLPGVRRLMDEFEIESSSEAGTRVRAVKWPARRARAEAQRYRGGRVA